MSNRKTNAHESALNEIHSFVAQQQHVKEMAAYNTHNPVVNAASMSMLSSIQVKISFKPPSLAQRACKDLVKHT